MSKLTKNRKIATGIFSVCLAIVTFDTFEIPWRPVPIVALGAVLIGLISLMKMAELVIKEHWRVDLRYCLQTYKDSMLVIMIPYGVVLLGMFIPIEGESVAGLQTVLEAMGKLFSMFVLMTILVGFPLMIAQGWQRLLKAIFR